MIELRALCPADAEAAWQLGRLAFGGPADPAPGRVFPMPGIRSLGVFDGQRLIGKAAGLEHAYWYGGRTVPGVGVAGVAIAPEYRGRRLLRELLGALLADARGAGVAVSALFPTTPIPYRRLGWELTGTLRWTAVPTAALVAAAPPGVRVRPAESRDVPTILDLYSAIAATSTGMLTRRGALFQTGEDTLLADHDGYTVAEQDDAVVGYCSWDRGPGYGADSHLAVPDLFAATPKGFAALHAMLGSWRSVIPTVHLRLRPDDPVYLATALLGGRTLSEQPWMLRLIDVAAAVAARGWPPHLSRSVDLHLEDDLCPWNAGPHRLEIDGGAGTLQPGGSGFVHLDPGALAVLYAGAAAPADLRRLGRLRGGDGDTDAFLAAAGAGPTPALLDYF